MGELSNGTGARIAASRSGLLRRAGEHPVLVITAGALVLRAPSLVRQLFDPDEAAIATMGMVVSRGGVLYRDVIDRKPPLAPLLYAMSFTLTGTRDLRPLHLLAALGLAGAALVVAYDVRRRAGARAGWWAAGLLLAGAVAFRPADAQAANYSHLALLPACGAIVVARRGTWRSAAIAGALLGVAVLTRQTWAIGVVPAAVGAWLTGGHRISRAVTVAAAMTATIAAIALVVPFGPFVHWTFTGNGSLLFDLSGSQGVGHRALDAGALFLTGHVGLCWLAARRGWRFEDLDLWLWLLTGVVAVVAGFRFFGHYWLQVLPPLCLLAAPAIGSCSKAVRLVLVVVVVVPAGVAWRLAWNPMNSTVDRRAAPLVAEVRAHSRPGDTIVVWGSFPEIYWLSGRAPGGALVLTDFLVGKSAFHPNGRQTLRDATPGALRQFLDDVRANPPVLFLDTAAGSVRQYQYYPVTIIPQVHSLLERRYRQIAVIDGVTIYQLRRAPRR